MEYMTEAGATDGVVLDISAAWVLLREALCRLGKFAKVVASDFPTP